VKKKQLKKEGDSGRKTVVRIERGTRGFYSCVSWDRKTNTQATERCLRRPKRRLQRRRERGGWAGGFIESFIEAVQLATPGRSLRVPLVGRPFHFAICPAGGRKHAIERSDTLSFLLLIRTAQARRSRCELDHSGRADTGRRKDIGSFLLGNFHKGLHHNRIELCAAVLYQTPPGFFMR
jgi:hypothetical protein